MLLSELAGRRVAILGAGREGRAVWRALSRRGVTGQVAVLSERAPPSPFAEELEAAGTEVRVGSFSKAALKEFDVLVRSPGVSPYRPGLQSALDAGGRMTSASSIWFAEHPSARTLCITGTKGKSTTTALTAHLLNAAGLRAVAAGNIGRPMLDEDAEGVDWWVLELSSYQLCDLEARPTAGAILNLEAEHLDWHGGLDRYRADKLRLARLVEGAPLVANHADERLRESLAGLDGLRWFNRPGAWRVDGSGVVRDEGGQALTLPCCPGRHNLSNLAAALALCEVAGALPEPAQAALDRFQALPHRLRTIGTVDGRRFVDDSLSTTPQAALAALEALRGEQVTWLVGGLDRGLDWASAAPAFRACPPRAVVALPDNGPHVLEHLRNAGLRTEAGMHRAPDLESAVALARELTPAGGVILLSPAAPSFPHFSDYRERGEAFARAAGL